MNYRRVGKANAGRELKDDGDLNNVEKFTKAFILPSKIIPLSTDIKLAIENNRFLCYNLYKGNRKFHIRQFETMDEILIPSKQGICMDFNCFIQFLTKFSEIDEHVTDLTAKRWVDLKIYIDENMTASITSDFDGIYLYKVQVGYSKVERASTGIALRLQEWDMLKSCVKELLEMKPELRIHQE